MENSTSNSKGAKRLNDLLESVDKWTSSVINDVDDAKIKEFFNDSVVISATGDKKVKIKPALIKKIQAGIIENTVKHVRTEFREVLVENNYEEKFQTLVEQEEKYCNGQEKAWRAPYDPHEHLRTERVLLKQEQLNQLQVFMAMRRSAIDKIKSSIETKMSELNSNQLTETLNQIKGNLEACKSSHQQIKNACLSNNKLAEKNSL